MALDVGGRHPEAERAYEWLRSMQREDGSWHAYYVGDDVKDPTLDTNVTCYIANGVWHHYLSTGDTGFLEEFWPSSSAPIDFALSTTRPRPARSRGGPTTPPTARCSPGRRASTRASAARSPSPSGSAASGPTGSSRSARSPSRSRTAPSGSSTRTAGRWTGTTRSWAARCAATPRTHGSRRAGRRSSSRVAGVRCVSDRPWVTAAETCECVMALDAIGAERPGPRAVHLGAVPARTTTAATGPARTSTTSASTRTASSTPSSSRPGTPPPSSWPPTRSVATGPTAGLFRGEGLPVGLTADELIAAGEAIESERGRATACHSLRELGSLRGQYQPATGSPGCARRTRREPVVETGANRRTRRRASTPRTAPGRRRSGPRTRRGTRAARRARRAATTPRSRRARRRTRGRRR